MKINHKLLFAVSALALIASPGIAEAKGKGKNHSDSGYEREYHHDGDDVSIRIDFGDREIISGHLRNDIRRHCPPGLAKKNPPCIPPGQAKKWRTGYPLPDGVVFAPVPYEWGLRAPVGYQYVRVDKDVLLIGEASKKVIDAVTLLSAVGN